MFKGIASALCASVLFGYLYYFSTLLQPLNGEDIFGYRIILTIPFVIASVFVFKQAPIFRQHLRNIARQPWLFAAYLFNSAILGFQMWLFLWAPNNGSALSVSFGYLLLPLVMVVAGHLLFKEQISRIKLLAVLIAALGVGYSILVKGGLSWESLMVSIGYTIYFSLRKRLKTADLSSFCIEMLLLLPVCIYFAAQVDMPQIAQQNHGIYYLLPLLGLISGAALVSYVLASIALPMNLLGLLGYTETILMVIVAFILGETLDPQSYPLMICLSLAMLLIVADGVYKVKRGRRLP